MNVGEYSLNTYYESFTIILSFTVPFQARNDIVLGLIINIKMIVLNGCL